MSRDTGGSFDDLWHAKRMIADPVSNAQRSTVGVATRVHLAVHDPIEVVYHHFEVPEREIW